MSEYTPGEVSKLLSVPGSTLRRYVAALGDHLSPAARKQRNREFSEGDIHVLARVRDLTGQGYRLDQIGDMLGEAFESPRVQPEELPPQTALMVVRSVLASQQDQADQIAALQAQLTDLQNQIAEMRRPWWKRLRKE